MKMAKRLRGFALLSASVLLLMAGPAGAQRRGSVEAVLQEAQEHANNFRADQAEAAFQQAYEMSPNDANVLNSYGQFKRHIGDYHEAIRLGRLAAQADPGTSGRLYQLGISYRYARDFDAAAGALRRAIGLDPALANAHSQLGFTEVSRGNRGIALRELQSAERLFGPEAPDWRLAQLAFAYAQLGRSEDVNRIYGRLQGMSAVTQASWVMADVARGSYGDALQHLEAAVSRTGADADSPVLGELRANVYYDPALEGPKFKALLDSIVAGD